MRLVIAGAALSAALLGSGPGSATDLRLLQSSSTDVLFTDLDARRTDDAGLRHGVTWRISAVPLPSSGAQVSRFEEVADCRTQELSTETITGYDGDLQLVQHLAPRPHWTRFEAETRSEFDALCNAESALGLVRLPTRDWSIAAVQFLGRFRRAAPNPR